MTSSSFARADSPDEGELFSVHARVQGQTRVFSKRRNDETEDQSDANKHGRKDDLKHDKQQKHLKTAALLIKG